MLHVRIVADADKALFSDGKNMLPAPGTATLAMKWSQRTGKPAKVYPKPLKGYEDGKAPEFYGPV